MAKKHHCLSLGFVLLVMLIGGSAIVPVLLAGSFVGGGTSSSQGQSVAPQVAISSTTLCGTKVLDRVTKILNAVSQTDRLARFDESHPDGYIATATNQASQTLENGVFDNSSFVMRVLKDVQLIDYTGDSPDAVDIANNKTDFRALNSTENPASGDIGIFYIKNVSGTWATDGSNNDPQVFIFDKANGTAVSGAEVNDTQGLYNGTIDTKSQTVNYFRLTKCEAVGVANFDIYKRAQDATNTPWQILKAVHSNEDAGRTDLNGKCEVTGHIAAGPMQIQIEAIHRYYTEDSQHPYNANTIYTFVDDNGNPTTLKESYSGEKNISQGADPRCDIYTAMLTAGKNFYANYQSNHNSWAKMMELEAAGPTSQYNDTKCSRASNYLLDAEKLGWVPPTADNQTHSSDPRKDNNKPWRWGDPGFDCAYTGPDTNRQLTTNPTP